MTADPRAAWLRLILAEGVGGARQRALLKHFGPPENLFAAPPSEVARVVGPQLAQRLLGRETEEAVERSLAWADEPGSHLVCLGDPAYPASLLETADPPTVLFVKGRVELLNRPSLALVGSRNATPQGCEAARQFARELADSGFAIVSGLALGIDAAAHDGGLEGSGSTVAVLGTGVDRIYPARNRDLAHRIAELGALASEFPLGAPPAAANFPRRNRLISGLSRGVIVVEAALASGSLITARLAAEQGREVFAVPGSIHSPLSKGCHQLIKQGAKLVESAADVLEELGAGRPAKMPWSAEVIQDEPVDPLLDQLGFDPCDLEVLQARTGLAPSALAERLLALEIEGRITALPGGRYQRLR